MPFSKLNSHFIKQNTKLNYNDLINVHVHTQTLYVHKSLRLWVHMFCWSSWILPKIIAVWSKNNTIVMDISQELTCQLKCKGTKLRDHLTWNTVWYSGPSGGPCSIGCTCIFIRWLVFKSEPWLTCDCTFFYRCSLVALYAATLWRHRVFT